MSSQKNAVTRRQILSVFDTFFASLPKFCADIIGCALLCMVFAKCFGAEDLALYAFAGIGALLGGCIAIKAGRKRPRKE